MHMYGNEGLELDPLNLGEVARGLVYEGIEELQEFVVALHHNFLVLARLRQRQLGVTCPDHLDAQKTHLEREKESVAFSE